MPCSLTPNTTSTESVGNDMVKAKSSHQQNKKGSDTVKSGHNTAGERNNKQGKYDADSFVAVMVQPLLFQKMMVQQKSGRTLEIKRMKHLRQAIVICFCWKRRDRNIL